MFDYLISGTDNNGIIPDILVLCQCKMSVLVQFSLLFIPILQPKDSQQF